jgi:crossover junction endodeoxyribonuclease RuvC
MNSTHTYIGVDPGLGGALAVIDSDGNVDLYDMPVMEYSVGKKKKRRIDIVSVRNLLRNMANSGHAAFIEEVNAMPGQGVTSMFNMGYGLGILHAVLTCLYIRTVRVRPQAWKKEFGLIKKDKGDSIRVAQELFPHADITLKKHHGRAESLLIAEYGRRQDQRQSNM